MYWRSMFSARRAMRFDPDRLYEEAVPRRALS